MDSKDVFKGTIKRCKDVESYNKYGGEHYCGDFRIGHTEIGTLHKYVEVIDENAILIKVSEYGYIWLDRVTSKFDELLVNLGIAVNTIGTEPFIDNALFIDETTLEPIFEDININLSVKKVKSLVPTFIRQNNKYN